MASRSSEPEDTESLDSPYRGLRSFSASDRDAALFFGREREQELIVANLLASRLTLLFGQSGIGKSSILCAGVVNRLRGTTSSSVATPRFAVVYVSDWHGDPHKAILDAVRAEARRLAGEECESVDPAVRLDEALAEWTRRLDVQLLLILDQFEQYFLYHPPACSLAFDRGLAEAIASPDLRLRCLVSLREDALVGLDRFKGKIPNLFENRLRLDGLTEEASRAAIDGPVDRYNEQRAEARPPVELEPGLANAVIHGLQSEVSPLARGRGVPLALAQGRAGGERIEPAHLQLVMEALWIRETDRDSTVLHVGTLTAMGGCAEIVRSHVESGLDGLPPRSRLIAARAIRYLITPSGTKIAHTPSDLASYTDLPEGRVSDMLERLCEQRIMRPLAPPEGSRERRYEVFHDLLAEPILEWRARFEAQRLRSRMRWLLASVIAATTAALAVVAYSIDPAPLHRLELKTLDARFAVRGTIAPDRDIVIVDLDEHSLEVLGHGQKTKALRPDYARLFDLLLADAPKVIADDIEFEERGNEQQLLDAIGKANGRIVLAAERFDSEGDVALFGREGFFGSRKLLRERGADAGYDGFPIDPGGVYRRMWRKAPASELKSLSVVVAEKADPGSVPPFSGEALIDYHGPPRTFPTVSMVKVLDGEVPAGVFKDKIVLFGTSAPSGEDLRRTSVTGGKTMPGVEIQANAISTVRHGLALRDAGVGITILLIVALSLTPLLVVPFPSWAALAIFVGMVGACLALIQLLFDGGVYMQIVYPLLALVLAGIGTLGARIFIARQGALRGRPKVAGLTSAAGSA